MEQLNLLDDLGEPSNLSSDIFEYRPGLFTKSESAYFLEKFITGIDWDQRKVMMYGKEVITPRLTAWFGDPGLTEKINILPWTGDLLRIREKVEAQAEAKFNYVLLNYYRDGNDSVAWHDDMDRKPGKNRIVASVSFGQERYFDIRNKMNHQNKFSILLEDGSYMLMKGPFQQEWEHRIAKSKSPMKPRINLTFRIDM